jgi:hypothetical protein
MGMLIHMVCGVVTKLMVARVCDPLALSSSVCQRFELDPGAPIQRWLEGVNRSLHIDSTNEQPTSTELVGAIDRSQWLQALQHVVRMELSQQTEWKEAANKLCTLLRLSHLQHCTPEQSPPLAKWSVNRAKAIQRMNSRCSKGVGGEQESLRRELEQEYQAKRIRAMEEGERWAVAERQRRENQFAELVCDNQVPAAAFFLCPTN